MEMRLFSYNPRAWAYPFCAAGRLRFVSKPSAAFCLLRSCGRNLQQQVRAHHSSPAGAEPHLWIAPVPFLDAGLFDLKPFELQQQWILLRLGRGAVNKPNRFGFTGGGGLTRVRQALGFTPRL